MAQIFAARNYAGMEVFSEANPAPAQSKTIETIALLVTCVSVILSQFQKQQTRSWALLVVGLLVAMLAAHRPLISGIRAVGRRLMNARVARRHRQELQRFSKEAGKFFSPEGQDTLQNFTMQVLLKHTQRLRANIPPAAIFQTHWYYLNHRIQHGDFAFVDFHNAADEFLNLFRCYINYCLVPLFAMIAAEFREVTDDNEKSGLNAFQQRFTNFISSYVTYLNRLNDEFRGVPKFQTEMTHIAPL